jgi:hypothetical protein
MGKHNLNARAALRAKFMVVELEKEHNISQTSGSTFQAREIGTRMTRTAAPIRSG